MSETTETPAPIQPEIPLDDLVVAIGVILRRSRGKAIIDCGDLDQQKIAQKFKGEHPGRFISSAEDLIDSDKKYDNLPSKESNGWIVTGYSSSNLDSGNKESEDQLQSVIRAEMNNRGVDGKPINELVVLSSSLPNTDTFNPNLPWYNGPFDESSAVWSLQVNNGKVKVIEQGLNKSIERIDGRPRQVHTWKERSAVEL